MNPDNRNFLPEPINTNVFELASGTALTGIVMYLGMKNSFPEYPYPFSLNEHASHPIAGLVVGYAIERSIVCADKLRQYSRQITAGVGLAIASVFETKYNYWYRNTTSDPADIAYTMVGVLYGIRCVRKNSSK